MTASAGKKFSINLMVQPQHLDAMQHVNNVIYLQWMQDIATLHWNSLATPLFKQQLLWMVRRHEIDYLNQAFLNDELLFTTWTGEYTHVTWKRYYEITRPADSNKIISASSIWIPIDVATKKPHRIDEAMVALFM